MVYKSCLEKISHYGKFTYHDNNATNLINVKDIQYNDKHDIIGSLVFDKKDIFKITNLASHKDLLKKEDVRDFMVGQNHNKIGFLDHTSILTLYDLDKGLLQNQSFENVNSFKFSPDGLFLCIKNTVQGVLGILKVLDTNTGIIAFCV